MVKADRPEPAWLLIPDLHSPYYDELAFQLVLAVAASRWWRGVVLLGDVHDFYQLSRYRKDPNRLGDLQEELDITAKLLLRIRQATTGASRIILRGNHENRLRKHLWEQDPALAGLRTSRLEVLFRTRELGFHILDEGESHFVNGWMITHGSNEDGCKLSSITGSTGKLNLARHWCSGIQGHSHRASEVCTTRSGQVFTWIEAGCLCDIARVSREYAPHADWQLAFAVLYPRNGGAQGHLIPISQGYECVFEGHRFKA